MNKEFFVCLSGLILAFAFNVHASAKEITVRGKLQRTVEAGGWLIVTDKTKYLILNPKNLDEKWFAEGIEVEATGETKRVATIYMEGTPFEVHSIHSVKQPEARHPTFSPLNQSNFLLSLAHA